MVAGPWRLDDIQPGDEPRPLGLDQLTPRREDDVRSLVEVEQLELAADSTADDGDAGGFGQPNQ